MEGDKPKRQKFKRYPIHCPAGDLQGKSAERGFFHIDIAEVQTAEVKLYLFVDIDRTSKFAVTQLVEKADRKTAWEFLQHMLEAVPYQVHIILTERALSAMGPRVMASGIPFAGQPGNRNTLYPRPLRLDMICEADGIEHRLTKPHHPWSDGQAKPTNRTIRAATVGRFHYGDHNQLRTHLAQVMAANNPARSLKPLGGLTPRDYICKIRRAEPERFILDPIHRMPGLNR